MSLDIADVEYKESTTVVTIGLSKFVIRKNSPKLRAQLSDASFLGVMDLQTLIAFVATNIITAWTGVKVMNNGEPVDWIFTPQNAVIAMTSNNDILASILQKFIGSGDE